ncbi:lysine 5,6-aminomutase subunit alpha TIM-barrel domain-containing protein [Actinomadura geliboluensis]
MLNDCMYGIIFRDINPRRTSAAVATPPASVPAALLNTDVHQTASPSSATGRGSRRQRVMSGLLPGTEVRC